MISLDLIRDIALSTPSKIVLLVMDGLGGLPHPQTGKTELETAQTPNLDELARRSMCGLTEPVSPGITPGSAPAHLALFGYDPIKYRIGRGVLEALGIDFDLQDGDVAARGNFCTVDAQGIITDRRAGRIPSQKCAELCQLLSQKVKLGGVESFIVPVREHRFVSVLRGKGLSPELTDTDPQREGMAPKPVTALSPEATRTAELYNELVAQAESILADRHPANMVLFRGFSQLPHLPQMSDCFKLKAAAIAAYPMYRGLAKLVGMTILDAGNTLDEALTTLTRHYADYDYFFVHFKRTDAAGEDGNFEAKVKAIEEVDALLPRVLSLKPDVLIVTGDHSTPAVLKGHSWHPVPFLLHSRWCRRDKVTEFSESACAGGLLGRFPALEAMYLAMAHALKLTKFGA